MDADFPGAIPEIPVTDLEAAAAYYEARLGFTVDWREESIGLAGVSRGTCRLILQVGGRRVAGREHRSLAELEAALGREAN
ncbi:hypothetical protein BH10PLA2_BH10PLA2_11340 [soil metagenome]